MRSIYSEDKLDICSVRVLAWAMCLVSDVVSACSDCCYCIGSAPVSADAINCDRMRQFVLLHLLALSRLVARDTTWLCPGNVNRILQWLLFGQSLVARDMHTDARRVCRPQQNLESAQERVASAGCADGKDGAGNEAAELEPTVDDLEWDDVIDLWANAHACYIEKDRSILADAKRCVSYSAHASLGAVAVAHLQITALEGPCYHIASTVQRFRTIDFNFYGCTRLQAYRSLLFYLSGWQVCTLELHQQPRVPPSPPGHPHSHIATTGNECEMKGAGKLIEMAP